MMLDRTLWSLLGASLLFGCAAGYPAGYLEGRAASSDTEGRAEASDTEASDTLSSRTEGEPETWAESLDGYVFGRGGTSGAREAATPRGEAPGRNGASGADGARQLAAAGARALEEGHIEKAFESFQAAHDVAPKDDRWIYVRVMANLRTGMRRDREALDLYLELFEIQPQASRVDSMLHGNLALVYYRLDRLSEARKAVERALELNSGFPEGLRTLGLIEIKEGRVEIGVDLLERAVALKRDIPEAQVALAEHDESVGRREKAVGRYRYLLAVMESEGFQDVLGRWRNLFGTRKKPTADEFRDRIRRLESSGENTDNTRG